MTKFKLGQQIQTLYRGKVVPSKITKRVKYEDLDTGESIVYYNYVHDINGGWSFSDVSEESLLENYREALDISMKKFVKEEN